MLFIDLLRQTVSESSDGSKYNRNRSMRVQRSAQQLYEENQRLGYRLNYLNDENNFYRISINNIKKLNQNINKHLLTTNTKIINSKHIHNKIDPKNVAQSYAIISNKIQLKNLQTKVGNSKRRVDKLEKLYEGSISTLVKKSEELEKEINQLARQYEYYSLQDVLLDKVFMLDSLLDLMKEPEVKKNTKIERTRTVYNSQFNCEGRSSKALRSKQSSISLAPVGIDRIQLLEEEDIRCSNKLEQSIKEEKELKKKRLLLAQKLIGLKADRQKLAEKVYGGRINLREAQALQVDQLKLFSEKETELIQQISKQDTLLEQQYKINQEYKQKIMDRNEQESKQIKVLQEEIRKYGEQVKEIEAKKLNLDFKNKKILKK